MEAGELSVVSDVSVTVTSDGVRHAWTAPIEMPDAPVFVPAFQTEPITFPGSIHAGTAPASPVLAPSEFVYVLTADNSVDSEVECVLVGPYGVDIKACFVSYTNHTPTVSVTIGGFAEYLIARKGLRRVSFEETVIRVAERHGKEVALWIND